MKRLKGQSMIFEQVILFSVATVIFIVSFAVFNVYQGFYLEANDDNQLDQAKQWISSNILKVSEHGESAESVVVIPLQRTIGDAVYEIRLDSTGLEIENLKTGTMKTSTLYYINDTYSLSGIATSLSGRLIIKKEDRQIIIS